MPLDAPLRRAAPVAAIALAVATLAPIAHADDKMTCVKAYTDAQTLRKAGKLRASRAQLAKCAADVCPRALRNDCRPWIQEVDDALGSVILAVRSSEGRDLVDVHVTVDGEPLTERLDGWALPMDPGTHVLRFEAPGLVALEQSVVVREGEKRREVRVVLTSEAKASDGRSSAGASDAARERDTTPRSAASAPAPSAKPSHTGAIVLAGVGVVGVGAFSYFAISGLGQKSDLDACKPACAPSQVDDARRTFLIGDIALGVGVVSLAAAAYLYFSSNDATTTGSRVDVTPTHGGARVGWTTTF